MIDTQHHQIRFAIYHSLNSSRISQLFALYVPTRPCFGVTKLVVSNLFISNSYADVLFGATLFCVVRPRSFEFFSSISLRLTAFRVTDFGISEYLTLSSCVVRGIAEKLPSGEHHTTAQVSQQKYRLTRWKWAAKLFL